MQTEPAFSLNKSPNHRWWLEVVLLAGATTVGTLALEDLGSSRADDTAIVGQQHLQPSIPATNQRGHVAR